MKKILVSILYLVCLLGFSGLQGQTVVQSDPLSIKLTVAKASVDSAGEIIWVSGEEANPGDVIRYTAVYANQTDHTLKNIVAQVPIPEGVKCKGTTAKPIPTEGSFDGKTFLPWAEIQETLSKADKSSSPLEIRTIRWVVPEINAHQSVELNVSALLITQRT